MKARQANKLINQFLHKGSKSNEKVFKKNDMRFKSAGLVSNFSIGRTALGAGTLYYSSFPKKMSNKRYSKLR